MPEPSPAAPARPDGIAVRAARLSDAETLAAISALPGFRHGTLRLPFRGPDETRRFLEGIGPDDVFVVAERGGAVLGSAGWRRFAGRRAHAATVGMGVHDDHVGRGIGTALMAALVDAADRWYAVRRLALDVFTDNAAAVAVYRRFGFEDEGVARGAAFRDGRYVDTLRMARITPVG